MQFKFFSSMFYTFMVTIYSCQASAGEPIWQFQNKIDQLTDASSAYVGMQNTDGDTFIFTCSTSGKDANVNAVFLSNKHHKSTGRTETIKIRIDNGEVTRASDGRSESGGVHKSSRR